MKKRCDTCDWYERRTHREIGRVTAQEITTYSHMCFRDSGAPETRDYSQCETAPRACVNHYAE